MKQIEREAITLMKQGLYNDAAVLLASIEKPKVTDSSMVVQHLLKYAVSITEYFLVVTVDNQSQILGIHEIAKGVANMVGVHPREVFRPAFLDNAVGIILAHNHPAGSLSPSEEDMSLTEKMVAAGEVLKIPVLDHIIVSKDEWISVLEVITRKKELAS